MICAYCANDTKPTREHVIPNFAIEEGTIGLSPKAATLLKADITVKDVCGTCNNGYLSHLDSYASKNIYSPAKNYLKCKAGKTICFSYDFDKAVKWMLKCIYNQERISSNNFTNPALIKRLISSEILEPEEFKITVFATVFDTVKSLNNQEYDFRIGNMVYENEANSMVKFLSCHNLYFVLNIGTKGDNSRLHGFVELSKGSNIANIVVQKTNIEGRFIASARRHIAKYEGTRF